MSGGRGQEETHLSWKLDLISVEKDLKAIPLAGPPTRPQNKQRGPLNIGFST